MQMSFPSVLPKSVYPVFFCECILNLLKGNLQTVERDHVAIFQSKVRLLSINVQLGSKEETFWRPKNAYRSLKLLLLPSLTICLDMEQFVLFPTSMYNKSWITQSVSRQDFPKCQVLQNCLIHLRRR